MLRCGLRSVKRWTSGKNSPPAASRSELAESGQCTVIAVPVLTEAPQVMLLVVDHRLLGDPVDPEGDLVADAARGDLDAALLAAQGERHGEDGLERVALAAAVRRDVCLAASTSGS